MTAADKSETSLEIVALLTGLYETVVQTQGQRVIENVVAFFAMTAGAAWLAATFSRQCAENAQRALASQGLTTEDVSTRKDASYRAKLTSLFGPMTVCPHAFWAPNSAFGPVGSR